MKCPNNCASELVYKSPIFACETCLGEFYQGPFVNLVLDSEIENTLEYFSESKFNCPECDIKNMIRIGNTDATLIIDLCKNCFGLWIDNKNQKLEQNRHFFYAKKLLILDAFKNDAIDFKRIPDSKLLTALNCPSEMSNTLSDANLNQTNYKEIPFKFTGSGQEYFKIWIVNTFLTIITLGIYSAWANVRKKKYLLRHTFLGNSSFDFHGNPIAILKGRIVIGILFLLYFIGSEISLPLFFFSISVFILLFPFIAVKGSSFNLRNTSYSNIRFDFIEDYKNSYKTYFSAGLLGLMTFGVGLPYFLYKNTDFLINNTKFGSEKFTYNGKAIHFYKLAFKSAGIFIVCFVGLILGLIGVAMLTTTLGIPPETLKQNTFIIVMISYLIFALIAAYYRSSKINIVASDTSLIGIQIFSSIRKSELIMIYFRNIFLIIFTLGFGFPWAVARVRKYFADNLKLRAPVELDLNSIKATANKPLEAYGDVVVDFWDLELGF